MRVEYHGSILDAKIWKFFGEVKWESCQMLLKS